MPARPRRRGTQRPGRWCQDEWSKRCAFRRTVQPCGLTCARRAAR
ncbi:hypothetical protein K788_0006425 [Paraburkholderia caribensis MBA4]|uniref:Uncharacterized protein n=1 Tax=Paraburkholderia caribensis MBA4 TaxID=1323664 RepID=A0A0P0RBR3_9BURK|nr:hypothetical protein K788_0006425 [Paraburkholderia caribensis MBA4]